MLNLSYKIPEPRFKVDSYEFAFRIYTMSNVYHLDKDKTALVIDKKKIEVISRGFTWAGIQRKCRGKFHALIYKNLDGSYAIEITAEHYEKIKGVSSIIYGIKNMKGAQIINRRLGFSKMDLDGTLYYYPYPWSTPLNDGRIVLSPISRGIPAPLLLIKHTNGIYTFALSMDLEVRPKRFSLYYKGNKFVLEILHDEKASRMCNNIIVPTWKFGRRKSINSVFQERMNLMEEKWGLKSWEERADIPTWTRKISLVVNMHGKHWTGYIFNTYNKMLKNLQWLAERIDGDRVLVFIAGFGGRYYQSWPLYKPDPELGGSDEFKKLVDGAHELGMHLIPMYGAVATSMVLLKKFGLENCLVKDKYNNYLVENWVDWDGDRERDNIWVPMNLGCSKFRNLLRNTICRITDIFEVDGAFLDICHFYENDPTHDFYEGLKELLNSLKKRYSNFLIFGEGWYDALLPLIPLYHSNNTFPENWNKFFLKYARMAYHLSLPSPSNGSTGIHEAGFLKFQTPDPNKEIIPTLSIVEDTIPIYADDVEKVITSAKAYAKKRGI